MMAGVWEGEEVVWEGEEGGRGGERRVENQIEKRAIHPVLFPFPACGALISMTIATIR